MASPRNSTVPILYRHTFVPYYGNRPAQPISSVQPNQYNPSAEANDDTETVIC